MTRDQIKVGLLTKVRRLIASGKLPPEQPLLRRVEGGFRRMSHQFPSEPCLICGKRRPEPEVAYLWSGPRAAFFHASCDVLWRQRTRREKKRGARSRAVRRRG